MSGQMELGEERQNLLDRLLDAVKQCQVRFGGKNELATESDSRVSCLLNQFEAIFQHGMKKSRTRVSAFRQVGKVTGIVKQDPEPVFWHLVKEHLGKLEEDQFCSLHNVYTDAGRGRSWLRLALNEQTLERYMRQVVGDKKLLSMLYEKEAFLMDEERSSMVPMMAAGLSSILFALNTDTEELNVVKQALPPQAFAKDVLNTLLPPLTPKSLADEPAPVYSGEVSEIKTEKRKKKKKKKKVLNAAIVSFEEDGNDGVEDRVQKAKVREKSPSAFHDSKKINFPLTDESFKKSKTASSIHSRVSRSPGNTDIPHDNSSSTSKMRSTAGDVEASFANVSETISMSDSSRLYNLSHDPSNGEVYDRNLDFKVELSAAYGSNQDEEKADKQEKDEEVLNFSFGALNIPKKEPYLRVSPGLEKQGDETPESLSRASKQDEPENKPDFSDSNSEGVGFRSQEENQYNSLESEPRTSVHNNLKEEPVKILVGNPFNGEELSGIYGRPFHGEGFDTDPAPSYDHTDPSDFGAVENSNAKESTASEVLVLQSGEKSESTANDSYSHKKYVGQLDTDDSSSFAASFHESSDTVKNVSFSSLEQSQSSANPQPLCDSPVKYESFENNICEDKQDMRQTREMGTESLSDHIVVIESGESLIPVISSARQDSDLCSSEKSLRDSEKNLRDSNKSFRESCDSSPGFLGEKAETSSLSSASWSLVEDSNDLSSAFKNELDASSDSPADLFTYGADDAALSALDACSDAQKGMSHVISALTAVKGTTDNGITSEDSRKNDSISTGELKQAMVAMMLRKDETEERNRTLKVLLDESRSEVEQLKAELEQSRTNLKLQNDKDSRKIEALTRENELLKHQLKKYVGAVQMMRSDLQGSQSRDLTEALAGIRLNEVLPSLPEQKYTEGEESEKVEEYKNKLIQVSEMHGELLEFNERLHKQVNAQQFQIRRLREELVNLRGPLPEDSKQPDEAAQLLDFDPCVMSINSRPLINVWIPSAFLRGRTSGVHHVYQLYVRIQDDEWNVYRRYSQIHELHKKLRRKYHKIGTFNFPPKKTIGNKDSQFVENRRRLLQDYLRRVVNLLVTSEPRLASCRDKGTFLKLLSFFGDPLPSEKGKSADSAKRKRGSLQYTGL